MSRDRDPQDERSDVPRTRLESWKAIAVYLGRDVRTVQRWERLEQLPVHRHIHKQRGTVFSYRDEIDRWLAQRRAMESSVTPRSPSPSRWSRWASLSVVAITLLVVLIPLLPISGAHEDSAAPPMTTSSPQALRLYERADALLRGDGGAPGGIQPRAAIAEELLEEALVFDPRFASAHLKLAIAQQQQGLAQSQYQHTASRAFELRDAVSDRERLMIESGYSWLMGDIDDAILRLEALTTLYPEDAWGLRTLSALYAHEDRRPEALETMIRLAELDADDFLHNALAASQLLMRGDNTQLDAANTYAHRAMNAVRESNSENWLLRARIELFPVYMHWMRGDVQAAVTEADRIAATLSTRALTEAGSLCSHLISVYLTLGKIGAARALTQGMGAAATESALTKIALAVESESLALEHAGNWERLVTGTGRRYSPGHWALARLGMGGELIRSTPPSDTIEYTALYALDAGLRALSDGQYERAIELLQVGLGPWQHSNSHGLFQALSGLAEAQLATGHVDAAIVTLETSSRFRGRAAVTGEGYWLRNQEQLALLYEERGLQARADSIRNELALLLDAADQDHPLASRLRELP